MPPNKHPKKPSYVSFVAHLCRSSGSPLHDICTVIFMFIAQGQPLRLAASFLTPRSSFQTRPNLGGVKDLSVSRSEVITVVPASPATFSGLGRNQAAESGASLGRLIRREAPQGRTLLAQEIGRTVSQTHRPPKPTCCQRTPQLGEFTSWSRPSTADLSDTQTRL